MDYVDDDKPMRAMYEHCVTVYNAMVEESTRTISDSSTNVSGADEQVVYEGHLTKLFQELGMSPPYYTLIRDLLIKMGCAEQLRRGGGNAKSRWRLVRPPSEEAFTAADALTKRPQGRVAMLEQGYRTLQRRIQRIEEVLQLPSGV